MILTYLLTYNVGDAVMHDMQILSVEGEYSDTVLTSSDLLCIHIHFLLLHWATWNFDGSEDVRIRIVPCSSDSFV